MGDAEAGLNKGIVTPKLPKRRKFPDVVIACCCEFEGTDATWTPPPPYLCARVNGTWYELFIRQNAENSFTVKSPKVGLRGYHGEPGEIRCLMCEELLDKVPVKQYTFGDSQVLDTHFMSLG